MKMSQASFCCEDTDTKRRLSTVGKFSFAIAKYAKVAKMVQQFVTGEQVIRVFRMANDLLIDQVGFKNDIAAGRQRGFHMRNERALEIVDIYDQLIGSRRQPAMLQVCLLPRDRERTLRSPPRPLVQSDLGNIDGRNGESFCREKQGVASCATGDIQRSPRRYVPMTLVQDLLKKSGRLFRAVALPILAIPSDLIIERHKRSSSKKLRCSGHGPRQRHHENLLRAVSFQYSAAFVHCRPRSVNIVDEQNIFTVDGSIRIH